MIFLMDLPDPVHGMSNMNLAIRKYMSTQNINPRVINTVPSYASNYFPSKTWVLFKLVHSIYCCINFLISSFFNIKGVTYRPINGGGGQFFDLIYLAIARLFLNKVFIHHHSYSYLNSYNKLFAFLNTIIGSNSVHIVLTSSMAQLLSEKYNIKNNNIRVVSNLALLPIESNNNFHTTFSKSKSIRLGYLSNVSLDKGIDIFIDICKKLDQINFDYKAVIAGPFADRESKNLVLKAEKDLKNLHYAGALYKEKKLDFYKNIDCFIFPSKYHNEAAPLVLYEAANLSNLLIGSKQGSMEDIIKSFEGFSLKNDENFSNNVVKIILDHESRGYFKEFYKKKRQSVFYEEYSNATEALSLLHKEMLGYELPKTK